MRTYSLMRLTQNKKLLKKTIMKKILITGSAGFIGSHLSESLVKKNYHVKALVHYNSLRIIGNLNFINKRIA